MVWARTLAERRMRDAAAARIRVKCGLLERLASVRTSLEQGRMGNNKYRGPSPFDYAQGQDGGVKEQHAI
jgi:hypothetical protein